MQKMLLIKTNLGLFYSFFSLYSYMEKNKISFVHGKASYGSMNEDFNLSISQLRLYIHQCSAIH